MHQYLYHFNLLFQGSFLMRKPAESIKQTVLYWNPKVHKGEVIMEDMEKDGKGGGTQSGKDVEGS